MGVHRAKWRLAGLLAGLFEGAFCRVWARGRARERGLREFFSGWLFFGRIYAPKDQRGVGERQGESEALAQGQLGSCSCGFASSLVSAQIEREMSFAKTRWISVAALLGAWGALGAEAHSKRSATAKAAAKAQRVASISVLYESAGASRAQVEPTIQALGQAMAKRSKWWDEVQGRFYSGRRAFLQDYSKQKPDLVILPLAAYLAEQKRLALTPIAEVNLVAPTQRQFYLVSADPQRKDCKGAKVASHHLGDWGFLQGVVAQGDWKREDFEWVSQRRPVQVLKTVLRGQSECALIDEAQRRAAQKLEGGEKLRVLWSSKALPSMIAATPGTSAAWRTLLPKLCLDASKGQCRAAGILGFSKLSPAKLKKLAYRYAKQP